VTVELDGGAYDDMRTDDAANDDDTTMLLFCHCVLPVRRTDERSSKHAPGFDANMSCVTDA